MSVFTEVDEAHLSVYLARFQLGRLNSFAGIESGIENSNYFVETDEGRYVLTLVEQFNYHQSLWFIKLLQSINRRGFPVPAPIADRSGKSLLMMNQRPVVLTPFVDGSPPEVITADIVAQLGACIGHLHTLTPDYRPRHPHFRDVHWCRRHFRSIYDYLSNDERTLIDSEVEVHLLAGADKLPCGVIHADLFRDNVFFYGGRLSAVIDFWHSGVDSFIYELAIACNDWCWVGNGYSPELIQALFSGYASQRKLNANENRMWSLALRRAALRFWLSRLGDMRCVRAGMLTHQKNPDEQFARLRHVLANTIATPYDITADIAPPTTPAATQ
ncbi:MAG: homoserine kinase [Proteobacteria bacterium]|nr:homoserine kinase [Pseudomonadota bacterium]